VGHRHGRLFLCGGPFNTDAALRGMDKIVSTDKVRDQLSAVSGKSVLFACSAGQVDPNVIGKHTTNVHLGESMVENFKPQVMIAPMLPTE